MRSFPPWSSEASAMHWICRILPSGSRNPDHSFPSSPLRTRSSYHGPVRTTFATLLLLLLPSLAGGDCLEPGLGRAGQALAADDVPGAITSFEGAAAACREAQDGLAESAALRELASAEGAQRAFEKARDHLSRAEELARAAGSAPRLASILGTRANLEHAAGANDAALASFDQAVALARTTDDAGLLAALLLSLGNLQGDQGRAETALPAYAEAVPLAERAGDALLAAQAEANAASVAERAGRRDEARSLAASARRRLELLPPSRGRIQTRIRVGRTLTHLAREAGPQAAKDAVAAHTCLAAAAHEAKAAGDARAASFAAGQIGELYEQHGRTDDALEMTRRALLAAATPPSLDRRRPACQDGNPAAGGLKRWHATDGGRAAPLPCQAATRATAEGRGTCEQRGRQWRSQRVHPEADRPSGRGDDEFAHVGLAELRNNAAQFRELDEAAWCGNETGNHEARVQLRVVGDVLVDALEVGDRARRSARAKGQIQTLRRERRHRRQTLPRPKP